MTAAPQPWEREDPVVTRAKIAWAIAHGARVRVSWLDTTGFVWGAAEGPVWVKDRFWSFEVGDPDVQTHVITESHVIMRVDVLAPTLEGAKP